VFVLFFIGCQGLNYGLIIAGENHFSVCLSVVPLAENGGSYTDHSRALFYGNLHVVGHSH
jgi:hypothetical protein